LGSGSPRSKLAIVAATGAEAHDAGGAQVGAVRRPEIVPDAPGLVEALVSA
jgi:hypothetical protein